ncbi:MAG: hypothetical protein ND895_08575 [Pyrinomonadaceae bacterium]|nr:hypothetical protein [Pyrinomonadaceae bacterium]
MKRRVLMFVIAIVLLSAGIANAQTQNTYGGGYSTGYGTVYGSFGLAMATQNMYNTMQLQMQKTMARNAMIKRWGLAAVEKAEREAKSGSGSSASSGAKIVVARPPVVRNHGVFRPDPTIDSGQAFAEALGETPEEKALIKRIYTATKAAYEKEAASKGWDNNIAGGLTLFTVTAMTIYRDAEEPSAEAASAYFKVVNSALDEMPEFATVANKDKQSFNNLMIGFSGLMLAGYLEGKQNNDAETIATYRKLAGVLINMVLKTNPDNITVENNQIVMK